MALHFIYGSSGSGKSAFLYRTLLELSQRDRRQQIFLVVPEQFTLQTQKELVRRSLGRVMMNIDVVSFERLAFRVADELGRKDVVLEETGKNLILRKIAGEQESRFTILRSNIRRMGTIDHIKSMISELMQYEVTPEDISFWLEKLPEHSPLAARLSDILLIYSEFLKFIQGSYITAEQILDVLSERAPLSALLEGAVFAFDGFTGFTPVQTHLMHALMKKASEMYVTVTFDTDEDFYCKNRIEDLFYLSRKMVQSLTAIAGEEGFAMGKAFVRSGEHGRFSGNPEMRHLENYLFRPRVKSYGGKQTQNIFLTSCMTPKQELEYAAASIALQVREKGLRYRDFLIVSGDAGTYENYAENVFRRYGIPFFSDSKRDILYHPLTECIRAALEIVSENYRQDSVFRFLRTGMTDLSEDETDHLENYVLAKGIRGHKRWNTNFRMPAVKHLTEEQKKKAADELQELNRMRAYIAELLEPLSRIFDQRTPKVREIIQTLYHLLTSLHAEEKIREAGKKMQEAGKREEASVNEQIWRLVMDLLDKYVSLLSEEPMEADAFSQVLDAGFSAVRVGIIPPDEDCVLLGDIERSRADGVKQLYFLGLNDGIVPKPADPGNLLSEYDRRFLKEEFSAELAPGAREEIFIQRFYLYWSLTKPSESLHLTFHQVGADGRSSRPSYLIEVLKELFPGLTCGQVDEEHPLPLVTPESGIESLIRGLHGQFAVPEESGGRTEEKEKQWNSLYRWYQKHAIWKQTAQELTDAAFFRAKQPALKTGTALDLYGSHLVNSVTRMENFSRCPFSHFLRYGLMLKERDTHTFEAVDLGEICHEIMARFSQKVGTGEKWKKLTAEEGHKLLDDSLEEVQLETRESVLFDSARDQYMFAIIRRMMQTSIDVAIRQIRAGEFLPERYEETFCRNLALSGDMETLPAGCSLSLVGKIDRLDVLRDAGQVPQAVRIVDYKSGSKDFSLQEFYYGLQMQLILYLQAAGQAASHGQKKIQPGGVFYFHLDDPVVEEKENGKSISEAVMEEMRLKGIVNASPDLYLRMDHGIAPAESSRVIPLKLNKDGSISAKGSRCASTGQFQQLGNYAERTLRRTGGRILEGDISIAPYQLGKRSGCDYCPYHSVCAFDSRLQGFSYRKLEELTDGEIWSRIDSECGDDSLS